MLKNKKRVFIYILAVFILISVPDITVSASSDKCKKVEIIITNNLPQTIKVTRVKYLDMDVARYRHETSWTPLKIAPHSTRTRTRHLEHVGGDNTKVYIYVKKHVGGTSWERYKWVESSYFRCTNRYKVVIKVD